MYDLLILIQFKSISVMLLLITFKEIIYISYVALSKFLTFDIKKKKERKYSEINQTNVCVLKFPLNL